MFRKIRNELGKASLFNRGLRQLHVEVLVAKKNS